MSELPRVDISGFLSGSPAEAARVAREWDHAMQTVGLVTIVGHGVSEKTVDALYTHASAFFGQAHAEKMRSCLHRGYGPGGFVPVGVEAVARSRPEGVGAPPDLVENLVFSHAGDATKEAAMPTSPAALQPAVVEYWAELHALLARLMELSAVALGLAPDHFAAAYGARSKCNLRLAHYPELAAGAAVEPGAQRYGAHTDYTGFTVLRQDPRADGLQAQLRSGEWVGVPSEEGALVVNAGDLIEVWTNDRWRSPPHRVLAPTPAPGGGASPARLSLVFFTGPADDTAIEALPGTWAEVVPKRHAAVTAGEHLRNKISASNTGK